MKKTQERCWNTGCENRCTGLDLLVIHVDAPKQQINIVSRVGLNFTCNLKKVTVNFEK